MMTGSNRYDGSVNRLTLRYTRVCLFEDCNSINIVCSRQEIWSTGTGPFLLNTSTFICKHSACRSGNKTTDETIEAATRLPSLPPFFKLSRSSMASVTICFTASLELAVIGASSLTAAATRFTSAFVTATSHRRAATDPRTFGNLPQQSQSFSFCLLV